MDPAPAMIVTCEHASNDVPGEVRRLFAAHRELLRSHRGYDLGALPIAERLAADLQAPLFLSRFSRLVVDLNRSATNRSVFSAISKGLPRERRVELIERYHVPYRAAVERLIRTIVAAESGVIHLSVHTFTPVLDGRKRRVDVGLLLDPARAGESRLCRAWKSAVSGARPDLRVRLNQPYRGVSDGLTSYLRDRFRTGYAGIEIEVNQALLARAAAARSMGALLARTVRDAADAT